MRSPARTEAATLADAARIDWGNHYVSAPRMVWPELDRQIAEARLEMGEARWAELNAEWEALS